jgi:hypothetical protein
MHHAKQFAGWTLVAVSVFMVLNGAIIYSNTFGIVRGTEFQMLITIANQLGTVMIWLGLLAIWLVLPAKAPEPRDIEVVTPRKRSFPSVGRVEPKL